MNKDKLFYKLLLTIAFPIMVQFFITSSINLMDNFMIGKLGDEAVAALGIANQYFFVFNLIVMGICSGCNVLISQFWGNKDIKNIKKILGISIIGGLIMSLIFLGLAQGFTEDIIKIFNNNSIVINLGEDYLAIVSISYIFVSISLAYGIASRGVQQAFLPMLCSAAALVVNIILNYILIFGHFNMPALGVKGAAIATLIARIVEMILMLSFIYAKKHVLSANFKDMFSFNFDFLKKTIAVVNPVVINELCWGLGMVIYSIIYGNMGTKSIAAVQINMSVQNMFLVILFAISNAACVMVGNEVGRNDFEIAKYYSNKLIKISLLLSIVMGVLLALSAQFILSFYNISNEVYNSTWYMLIITALILPVRFINVLLIVGILRGGGDTSYVLKVELITMWLVGVPLCLFGALVLKLEVYQVFLLVTGEEMIKCVVSVMRYRSGKWMRKLIGDIQPSS